MKTLTRFLLAALLLLFNLPSTAENAAADPVLTSLQQELHRSFQNLKKQPVPAYFLAYQLTDNHAIQVNASFGALG